MSGISDNSDIVFKIDEGDMRARVEIPEACDVASLEMSLLLGMLHDANIAVDVEVEARLQAVIDSFLEKPRPLSENIAEGVPPESGENGTLEWMEGFDPAAVESASDGGDAPADGDPPADNEGDDSGTASETPAGNESAIDFYNQVSYIHVSEGTHVATVHPPTDGVDGHDVCGKNLPATPGRKYDVSHDASLAVNDEGKLIAQCDGILQYDKRQIKVTRLLQVRDYVDFSTGNIDFDGSIEVRGGVRDLFIVKASEDITVNGLIEAATIQCGGNFTCTHGMAGREKGIINILHDAEVNYLNAVRGLVKGKLTVHREIISCVLVIGGGLMAENASIIGGEVSVTGDARIGTLGTDAGTETCLVLGACPLISAAQKKLKKVVKDLETSLAALEDKYDLLNTPGRKLAHNEKEELTEMSFNMAPIKKELHAARAKLAEIEEAAAHAAKVHVEVTKAIFPGVRLLMGKREIRFKMALKGPIFIGWDEYLRPQYRQGTGPICRLDEVATVTKRAA